MGGVPRHPVLLVAWLVLAAASLGLAAAAARATDQVYWSNFAVAQSIGFANLDSSGTGGNVNVGGAMLNSPAGVAIDSAANKVYWVNYGGGGISFANLDGSGGGGQLNTSPVVLDKPAGVALDPSSGRIYWADMGDDKIEFANLNGSGGGIVNTAGVTPNQPEGVAVDPATGKIYWADFGDNAIEFANLDESGGGGQLSTAPITPNKPIGVAVDPATGQVFWANSATSGTGANTISFANVDDTGGGGYLNTAPVAPDNPQGVAVDPSAGKVYWANFLGNTIDVANVNGSGGGVVNTSGMTVNFPVFPALLKAPRAAGPPAVIGGGRAQTTLSCSGGTWGAGQPASLLYEAPQSFSYAWTDDGAPIAGATRGALSVSAGGNYACQETAHNQAGSTTQTSASHPVAPTLELGPISVSGTTATVTIFCAGDSAQTCSGSILGGAKERRRGRTVLAVTSRLAERHEPKKQKVTTVIVGVATASYSMAGGRSTSVRITLNKSGRGLLAKFYRLSVQLAWSGTTNQTIPVTYSYPRLRPTVHNIWTWTDVPCSPCFTTVNELTLTGLKSTERVTLRCSGRGCRFGQRVTKRHGPRLALARSLAGAHLRPGTALEIAVTAPNTVGFVQAYTIVTGGLPRGRVQCLPPGARAPTRCA